MGLLIIISFLFVILVSVFSSTPLSIFSIGVFILLTGSLLCYLLSKGKQIVEKNLLVIFFLNFTFYLLYAVIVYYSYIEQNDFFLFSDQRTFYESGNYLSQFTSIKDIFNACFVERIHIETEGAYFIFGIISFLADRYLDGNSILLQSICVSYFAILTNLFVYKTLSFYVLPKQALKYTLFYALLTPIFFYSPWILRDIHIAFLYSIGIYLIHTSFSIKKLLLFIPLIIITAEFRLEHGFFYLVFPLLYILLQGRNHPNYKVIIKLFLIIALVFSGVIINAILPKLNSIREGLSRYELYTEEALNYQGLGHYLYELPVGIKQIAIIIYSQISSFPPWAIIEKSSSFLTFIIGVIKFIVSVYWSLVFFFIVYSSFFKKSRMLFSKNMIIYLTIVFLFFLLNTSNMNDRRLIALYPLIYVVYVYLRNSLSNINIKKLNIYSVSTYTILILIYTTWKFIL